MKRNYFVIYNKTKEKMKIKLVDNVCCSHNMLRASKFRSKSSHMSLSQWYGQSTQVWPELVEQ